MRDAFFRALTALGAADERVWALTGDLGVGLFEPFEAAAPGRYLNVGIAEQTLVGVAAGLAYAGKVPFAYSIAPFVTSRPHDQVRVDVACARANVKLVGVGSGVSYGTLGPTHHAIDDLATMRVLPGMTVLAPGDPAEAERAVHAAWAHEGPVYLRLGKNGEPAVLPADAGFAVGRALELRSGADVTIACTGTALREAAAAADLLAESGVDGDPAPLRYRQAARRRRARRRRGAHGSASSPSRSTRSWPDSGRRSPRCSPRPAPGRACGGSASRTPSRTRWARATTWSTTTGCPRPRSPERRRS